MYQRKFLLLFFSIGLLLLVAGSALRPLPAASAADALSNLKLNGMLQPFSGIHSIKISPDGKYVLFTADIITDDAYELYSVPIDGSAAPTLLSSGLLPAGTIVDGFFITPDSSRVVYVAEQDTADVSELYSVPLTGGPITKLNPPITALDGNVDSGTLTFSPDGSRVVFLADWQIDNIYELFSVPTSGGIPVRLNDDLVPNGTLNGFEITPDGSHVVYTASQDDAAMIELYIVPLTGGESDKLNDPLVAGGTIWSAKIGPDGSHVVYTADQEVANQWELFSVSLVDPLAPTIKLNPPLGATGDVIYTNFRISPDGSRVVYIADQVINDLYLLYSVPIGGGTAVQLNKIAEGAILTGFDSSFEISPDSSRVVYRANRLGFIELFTVSITGGEVTTLNGPIIADYGDVHSFQISSDSSRVVYLANQQDDNSEELYSVPIAGGEVAKLNSALPSFGNVLSFQISPDSSRVVYRADQQVQGMYEIYSVPLTDGEITKLNLPLVAGGDVSSFQISPNSNHVVYVADQEIEDVRELFVTFDAASVAASQTVFLPFIQN